MLGLGNTNLLGLGLSKSQGGRRGRAVNEVRVLVRVEFKVRDGGTVGFRAMIEVKLRVKIGGRVRRVWSRVLVRVGLKFRVGLHPTFRVGFVVRVRVRGERGFGFVPLS